VWVLGSFSTKLAHPSFQINSYLYIKHYHIQVPDTYALLVY